VDALDYAKHTSRLEVGDGRLHRRAGGAYPFDDLALGERYAIGAVLVGEFEQRMYVVTA
jgi:hypothetical protein